jgi:3-hydroxypropanoate dehydrogenase
MIERGKLAIKKRMLISRDGKGVKRLLLGKLADESREAAAFRNSSLQGAYFIIAARSLGLDTGPMSGFDNAAVDATFFKDTPQVRSNFISTLGYGDPAAVFGRSPRPAFGKFNRIE